jgi:DNA polymerase-1
MMVDRPLFLLIDGHALIYRAYHAYPSLTDHRGQLVNAVYGFTRILLTAIRDHEPEYLAVAFDHKDPTFRHQAYDGYKAHREEMPDDLKPQIDIIKQVVETLNIPKFEVSGYEADDLVGSIAAQASAQEKEVVTVIVSGDKDLLQLVNDDTRIFIPARGKFGKDILYDDAKVVEKMGVRPDQVPDLKGLMGDSSDNIPGVKGVGKKTATKLIQTFESVEKLYEVIGKSDEVELIADRKVTGLSKSVLAKLVADKEQALMSKQLATIDSESPVKLDLAACMVKEYDKQQVIDLFSELDFNSLTGLLPEDKFEADLQSALF